MYPSGNLGRGGPVGAKRYRLTGLDCLAMRLRRVLCKGPVCGRLELPVMFQKAVGGSPGTGPGDAEELPAVEDPSMTA